MSITLDQIILDAQRIANRLKDREALGNAILVETEGINRQLETMKQFQDDIDALNQLTRDKSNAEMVNRINQQNPSIREIRQENRELKASLEDHQRAMELIMQKYREHTQHKILNSHIDVRLNSDVHLNQVVRQQNEKIAEMAAVMQRAAAVDDDIINNEIESISRLRIENQGLRELLQISREFGSTQQKQQQSDVMIGDNKSVQTDENKLKNDEICCQPISKILMENSDENNFEKNLIEMKKNEMEVDEKLDNKNAIETALSNGNENNNNHKDNNSQDGKEKEDNGLKTGS